MSRRQSDIVRRMFDHLQRDDSFEEIPAPRLRHPSRCYSPPSDPATPEPPNYGFLPAHVYKPHIPKRESGQPVMGKHSCPVNHTADFGYLMSMAHQLGANQRHKSKSIQLAGDLLEVVITLDTTESKASLIADIQATIPMLVKRLFGDLPQLRLSVLGHGDYDTRPYVMRLLDFTDNASHGVRVYGVQLYADGGADQFWSYLAMATGGKHIDIGPHESLVTTAIMAICYKEAGAEHLLEYTADVLAQQNQMGHEQYDTACAMFSTLSLDTPSKRPTRAPHLCVPEQLTPPPKDVAWQECYEVLLRQIREQLSWTTVGDSRHALIMIGDSRPLGLTQDREGDASGIHIYAVQIFSSDETDHFWCHLAGNGEDGMHLQLGDMGELLDNVISKHAAGAQSVFGQLSGSSSSGGAHPDVTPHRVLGDQKHRRCSNSYVENKIRREEVVPRFVLQFSAEWSLWYAAMIATPLNVNLTVWKPRRGGRVGYRNADSRILAQLDRVIERGCTVHLRRMLVTQPVTCDDKELQELTSGG
ncbi:hypothetical protein NP493_376g00013 [Ridgeia piscesae]|uniref:Uncharacterized protein n=1 Tax=Ridgeia piscesae TaxID=27915 RepID=A0AAD9NVW9_RIDPI|nr:hypothetical protein NP493_376g00013 [Ridgeia piscesae]